MNSKEKSTSKQNPLQQENNQKPKEKKTKTVKELEREVNSLKEEKLRLLADQENERKQNTQRLNEWQKYANERLIKEIILPLLDNYERAMKFNENNQKLSTQNILTGLRMALVPTWESLRKEGVEEIKVNLQKDLWDSKFHEVGEEIETNEYPPGTILEVLQKGYLLNQRVLVTTKVKVSKEKVKKEKN